MSEIQSIAPGTRTDASSKMLITMVGIGILCALFIVLTFEGTKPRIAQLREEALQKAVFNVLPGISETRAFELLPDGGFAPANGESKTGERVYAGYDGQGNLIGIAIEASGQGYADIIRILYGYDPGSQKVIGFYVLESKETPGLGDKIQKDPAFLENFNGLDVTLDDSAEKIIHPVKTVKQGQKQEPWEIDGITGATISSRAIGSILESNTSRILPLIQANLGTFQLKKND